MDVGRWVVVYIATVVGEDADTLDRDAPMSIYDFDSMDAVEMAFAFEKRFGREVDPEWFMSGDQTVSGLIALLDGVCTRSEPGDR